MFSSKKWLSGIIGLVLCLLLAAGNKEDVQAGKNYQIGSYIVCTEDTKLFTLPDCNEGVVTEIAKGSVATVVENDKIYTKVNYNDMEGYLYQEFIGNDEEIVADYVAAREAEIAAREAELLAQSEEIKMIAAMIQCEAGWEPYEGQTAVGAVIMNRLDSETYPDTVYEVLNQPNQFGPADSDTYAELLETGDIRETCRTAAIEAYQGLDNTGGALHFRRAGSREGLVIGNHVFY